MNVHVVLVRTEYASNVGSVARALANMGGNRLILIDPQCELDSKARQMAAGAQEKLGERIIYPSWSAFFENENAGVRIALTRRGGRNRKVFQLDEKVAELKAMETAPSDIYLILGPEADGLDSNDLGHAHFSCHLPVFGDFASLNLAQAAMLSLYLVRSQFKPEAMPRQVTGEVPEAVQPLYVPDQLIKDWLTAMGFDVSARRASAFLTLRRLFLQNLPTRHEIQVLEAILRQNIRKLRGDKNGSSLRLTTEELADDIGDIPV